MITTRSDQIPAGIDTARRTLQVSWVRSTSFDLQGFWGKPQRHCWRWSYSIVRRWLLAVVSFLGSVSVSTPLSYLALDCVWSMSIANWKLRDTAP